MSDNVANQYIPYSTMLLWAEEDYARFASMSCGVRVIIQLNIEDFEGDADGIAEARLRYQDLAKRIDDEPQLIHDLENWMFEPCIPHLRHLSSPENRFNISSLQDYYHATTMAFDLKMANGRVEAFRAPADPLTVKELTHKLSKDDQAVISAIQQGISCISASDLVIIRGADVTEWEFYDISEVVMKLDGDGRRFLFKKYYERDSFARELDVLMRTRSISQHVNIIKLAAMVQWDDLSIGGLLFEYIPEAHNLDYWWNKKFPMETRMTWMNEIRQTVSQLHKAGLIWGSLHRPNILIDAEGHAWATEFGGASINEWVEKGLRGTMEGDLCAL